MVGVLEDVVVEAGLHRGDGELLASSAGAEDHRHVGMRARPHLAEDVEGVDPAGPVVGDHDVEVRPLEDRGELARIREGRRARRGQAGAQGLDDRVPVPRVLVDDEDPQFLPGGPGPGSGTEGGRGFGSHRLRVV